MDDLDRLFQRLVQVLRNNFPSYFTEPFEVAELYQTLIPYRHHRRELGIETNQDYEIAVMRLLAGERGYLQGEEKMQATLRQELESPNPDPTLFRAFAHSQIHLAPDATSRVGSQTPRERVPVTAGDSPPEPSASAWRAESARSSRPSSAQPAAPSTFPGAAPASPMRAAAQPSAPPPPQSPLPPPPGMANTQRYVTAGALGGRCRYCGGTLPDGRRLVFCPHCGQNLTIQHCPACSTELEMGWKFCTTCGRSVSSA